MRTAFFLNFIFVSNVFSRVLLLEKKMLPNNSVFCLIFKNFCFKKKWRKVSSETVDLSSKSFKKLQSTKNGSAHLWPSAWICSLNPLKVLHWAEIEDKPLRFSALDRGRNKVAFTSNAPRKQSFLHHCYRNLQATNKCPLYFPELGWNHLYFVNLISRSKWTASDQAKQNLEHKKQRIKQSSISKGFLSLRMLFNTTKSPQTTANQINSPRKITEKLWHITLKGLQAFKSIFQ